jgi:8-oxo-dGTP pyrophosphatase MutT (NUDIX family)
MRPLLFLNPEGATEAEIQSYEKRESSRAVIFDTDGNVAFLHVTKHDYYKLPGGGLEEGEDALEALRRECLEETGCELDNIQELGLVTEWRKYARLLQLSYSYRATVKGQKGIPQFVGDEISDGFECIWVPIDEAIRLMSASVADNLEGGKYVVPRDTEILRAAKKS